MTQTNVPDFSLAYTSCRPHLLKQVVELWNSRSTRKNHEFVIAVDDNNPEIIKAALAVAQEAGNAKVVIQSSEPYNCVKGWNLAAEHTVGKVIIAVADDFVPPIGWDQSLLDLQPTGWQDGEWVVHTEDGYVHDIFVLGIITRKRYEKFGYFFYPGYESMFSDTELTVTAQRDGVVIEARHLLFEHMHPDAGKRGRDAADVKHASSDRWARGEMLFNWRNVRGFKVDMGPKAVLEDAKPVVQATSPSASSLSSAAPVSGRKWAAYIQVTKDEFFLYDICVRLFEEGVKNFFFCIPDEYWAGNVTPASDIAELQAIAAKLGQDGANAFVKIFDVSVYRYPGDTRLHTETRVRNDSLAWIRSQGFRDILIVDSDELWLRGTLQVIDECVARGAIAISSPMIPVIGTPGYPVERATDVAIVYIGGNAVFQECRSPMIKPVQLQIPYVIHFTATRRTLEETIVKLRASGHYDDPQYAFELFIEKVLPNIKPGFTYKWPTGHVGLHFYLPYQIWPSVRHWRMEERNQIPRALLPHLGPMPE